MLPPLETLKSELEARVQGLTLTVEGTTLVTPREKLLDVCRWLKDAEPLACDYLADLTAVDYPPDPAAPPVAGSAEGVTGGAGRLDVVYHLYSMSKKHGPVTLKVSLPRANPVVASVTPIWRGAEFQEREAYDLFGVRFEGHPDLRRILLWDEFEGHPMRKDYVVEDQNVLGGQ